MQGIEDQKLKEETDASEDPNWRIEASDDESYEPSPEEIIELYETLEAEGVLELEWQCPGRRPPSPAQNEFLQEEEEDLEFKPEEKSDFDFKDEMSAPSFTPRRVEGGPKGSAKKKTTSLDGILSNMRRHRQMEEMEKQASNAVTVGYLKAWMTVTSIAGSLAGGYDQTACAYAWQVGGCVYCLHVCKAHGFYAYHQAKNVTFPLQFVEEFMKLNCDTRGQSEGGDQPVSENVGE